MEETVSKTMAVSTAGSMQIGGEGEGGGTEEPYFKARKFEN